MVEVQQPSAFGLLMRPPDPENLPAKDHQHATHWGGGGSQHSNNVLRLLSELRLRSSTPEEES